MVRKYKHQCGKNVHKNVCRAYSIRKNELFTNKIKVNVSKNQEVYICEDLSFLRSKFFKYTVCNPAQKHLHHASLMMAV